jgi:uncharacterized protein
MIDRIAPTERSSGRAAGFQSWRHLLFLHWQVPVNAVQALLPKGLTADTFEGRAYVGVVPFTMRDVRPRWSPSIPGISDFHELNVRTYVHQEGRNPGVWFFSLDAAKLVAVLAARALWHLPYHWASMSLVLDDDRVHYQSRRLWPEPIPADFEARYRIGKPVGHARPGTFEHFLAERYILFAETAPGRLSIGRVHHTPYPLHHADLIEWREWMVKAAGLPEPQGEPHVLYSPGVDVEVFALRSAAV